MSTVNVVPSRDVAGSVSYALYGNDPVRRQEHQVQGTTRAAALSSTIGNPDDFVSIARANTKAHARRVEAYSYTQNFSPYEFDVHSQRDVQRVNELGVKLAERMHTADYLVVTHVDSAGGHLHNHIYCANHDKLTGKSIQRNTSWVRGLRQVNDELMRDEGCEVLPSPDRQKPDWSLRREEFPVGGFERTLGDHVAASLRDPRAVDLEAFTGILAERDVTLTETHRDGWTYKMRRTDNNKLGRRKASSLTPEFTADEVQPVFEYHYENKETKHGNIGRTTGAKTIDFGDTGTVDVEARRRRTSTHQANEISRDPDRLRESHGRVSDQQPSTAIHLAAARAALESNARRRDKEQAERDRENARERGATTKSERGDKASRRDDSQPKRPRVLLDDATPRADDEHAEFDL
jgi:hypothetical protein